MASFWRPGLFQVKVHNLKYLFFTIFFWIFQIVYFSFRYYYFLLIPSIITFSSGRVVPSQPPSLPDECFSYCKLGPCLRSGPAYNRPFWRTSLFLWVPGYYHTILPSTPATGRRISTGVGFRFLLKRKTYWAQLEIRSLRPFFSPKKRPRGERSRRDRGAKEEEEGETEGRKKSERPWRNRRSFLL